MPSSGGGTLTPIADPTITTTTRPDHSAPLLPLDEWRRLMGFNPWHFWQFDDPNHENTSACNGTVWEYSWQGARTGSANAAGRADIREALFAAENKIKPYTGFSFAPRFELDEVAWPRNNSRRAERLWSADATGRWVNVQLPSGKVRALGVPRRTFIGNAAVTLSDPDGDGLTERFTLTIGTTVTDPNEIACYFVAADRLNGEDVGENWRVLPVKVTITSGTATIIGRAWTIGKPVLHEGTSATELDPTDAGNFAATLAVYRYYADSTDQGAFVWESTPSNCCEGATDPSSAATAGARFVVRDSELGYVAGEAASYNTTTSLYEPSVWGVTYEPATVRVNYQAGAPLDNNGQMQTRYQEILARLASAELARAICACQDANMEMHRWQFDRARSAGANEEQYSLGDKDLNNPLGVREGQIWAWNQIKNMALGGASLA